MNLEREKNNRPLIAHLSMFGACAGWGLMAPVGKDAMTHGIDGITMVTFRVVGACLLFWIASRFAPKEEVPMKDKLMFIGAALMGLVLFPTHFLFSFRLNPYLCKYLFEFL